MTTHTFSRLSDGASGLLADVRDGRLVGLSGDPSDPVSEGRVADVDHASIAALDDPRRITQPMRRSTARCSPRPGPRPWPTSVRGCRTSGAAAARRARRLPGAGRPAVELDRLASGPRRRPGQPHVFSELSLGMGLGSTSPS